MNTKNAGITLFELIIVIALMGIIAAAAALSLRGFEKYRLSQAMVQLQSDLRYIRKVSLSGSVKTRIIFDKTGNSYKMQKANGNAYETIKIVELESISLDSVNSPMSIVEYTPRATTANACTIVMSTEKYKGSLTVNVGSGRVKIKEITKK